MTKVRNRISDTVLQKHCIGAGSSGCPGIRYLLRRLLFINKEGGGGNQDVYKRQGKTYSFAYDLPAYGVAVFKF